MELLLLCGLLWVVTEGAGVFVGVLDGAAVNPDRVSSSGKLPGSSISRRRRAGSGSIMAGLSVVDFPLRSVL